MNRKSFHGLFFSSAVLLLVTGLGISPISCGDKQAQTTSNELGTGGGVTGGTGAACVNHALLGDSTEDESMGFLNDGTPIAQQFTIAASETISEVDLNFDNAAGSTGTVMLTIETDGGGMPSATVVGANPDATANIGAIGSGFQSVPFVFGTPLALSAGTYWIVARTSGMSSPFFTLAAAADNAQPGFAYSNNGGASWNSLGNNSLQFQILGCP